MKASKKTINVVLAMAALAASIAVLLLTFFLINENAFPLSSFTDRIVSAASVRGADISTIVNIYMVGLTIAGILILIFYKGMTSVFSARKFELLKQASGSRLIGSVIFCVFAAAALFHLSSLAVSKNFPGFMLYLLLFIYVCALLWRKSSDLIRRYTPHLKDIGFYFSLFCSVFSLLIMLFDSTAWHTIAKVVILFLSVILPVWLRPSSRLAVYALPMVNVIVHLLFFRSGGSSVVLFIIKLFLFAAAVVVSFIPLKIKSVPGNRKVLCYCLLISGLCFIGSESFFVTIIPDYFEYANHAMSISGLIDYGKIPVLETFDAHMLSDQIPGYIYYILGGNSYDAAIYCLMPGVSKAFFMIFVFLLLSEFIDKDKALMLVLVLPQVCFSMSYLPFAFWVTYKLIKKDRFIMNILFWLVMVFSALYRLDEAMCCVISCVPVMLYYLIRSKNFAKLRRFIVSFVCVLAFFALLFSGICLIKGIDILAFVQRFLLLTSKSNQNWAYGVFGFDEGDIITLYYMIHAIIAALLAGVIVLVLRAGEHRLLPQHYIVAAAGIVWFANVPRTIVRHNLVEREPIYLLHCAVFFILLYALLRVRVLKKRTPFLCVTVFALVLLPSGSLADRINNEFLFQSISESVPLAATESRLSFDRTLTNRLSEIFDALLKDNETFYDFSNNGLFFTLTGRENPVYENQSPGILSGETAQKFTIAELEKNKERVACALFPAGDLKGNKITSASMDGLYSVSLDGIFNEDRYFLLAEYLYRNFTPVLRWDKYDIWIRNTLWDERKEEINSLGSQDDIELLSVVSTNDFAAKIHNSGAVPYLWANADVTSIEEKKFICRLDSQDGVYSIDPHITDNTNGNYVCVKIAARKNDRGLLVMDYDGVQEQYGFDVSCGTTDYLFRVSSSYKWFISDRITLTIKELGDEAEIKDISILTDD